MKSRMLVLALVIGCTPARMAVPPQMAASSDELRVTEKPGFFAGDTLKFGPYRAREIHQGWTVEDRLEVNRFFHTDKGQSFGFRLFLDEAPRQRVACRAALEANGVQLGNFRIKGEHLGLACRLGQGENPDAGWLVIEEEHHHQTGRVMVGEVTLEIDSDYRAQGTIADMRDPVGYKIYENGKLVAAVQTINDGAVWLSRDASLEVRQAASLAAAALLLFPQLRS
jgi:hypothetical protein